MIGLICALDVEVENIKKEMDSPIVFTKAKIDFYSGVISGKRIVCAECGVGKVNAAMCAQIMIDRFSPDLIINSGIAGSLSEEISIGDIVISDDCVQHDYDGTEMGDPLGEIWYNDEKRIDIPADKAVADRLSKSCETLEDTKVFRGRIASGDVFVSSRERRSKIASHFSALACEMEGGAVGQVCYRNSVPYAVLRCISDDFSANEFMDFLTFRSIAAEKSVKAILDFIRRS